MILKCHSRLNVSNKILQNNALKRSKSERDALIWLGIKNIYFAFLPQTTMF